MEFSYIDPSEVWEIFQKNKASLGTRMKEIANNADNGVVIMLSTVGKSGEEQPDFIVSIWDEDFYEESCFGEKECLETVRKLYRKYILGDEDYTEENEDDIEEDIQENEIREREEELDIALYDFLDTVFEGDILPFYLESDSDMFQDCKEHFLEYIARKWSDFRRPMYLEDDEGNVEYEEYPYVYLCEDEDDIS